MASARKTGAEGCPLTGSWVPCSSWGRSSWASGSREKWSVACPRIAQRVWLPVIITAG
jgi:hypothetical protein